MASKYPNSAIPRLQTEWEETKHRSGLELSFQNMIEWNLKMKLTGYNETTRNECSTFQHGCENIPLSTKRMGIRLTTVDWHFQPQVFNCPVCGQYQGDKWSDRFVARLENPNDLAEIYRLNGLQVPDDLKLAKFNDHFTGTNFDEARSYYGQIPAQMLYNFIKMFEPDYLAFGYPLPFTWLKIPPISLSEFQTTRIFNMPNNPAHRLYTPLE